MSVEVRNFKKKFMFTFSFFFYICEEDNIPI